MAPQAKDVGSAGSTKGKERMDGVEWEKEELRSSGRGKEASVEISKFPSDARMFGVFWCMGVWVYWDLGNAG
ncbi:hypothetical protein N7462_009387 [Penicillium macrosclerotiorum]|uniref:uncharacterized protein n=1 Tax=Penicillium macrosclerotiorum TaxID=303699 RepID=UPI0025471DE9|nr:uncharacterized protein N7462_009387 [Penicillium macrosclerotiorum]KAJ5673948.1 hypothetical protein N7462_009387 [Penicillium macrosclerotiorum]